MATHRYWRVAGIEACGAGDLELSGLHLLGLDGARLDASATLTASVAPDVAGALADLQDTATATAARWSAQAVKTLALSWDFGGAPVDVGALRLSGASQARFLLIAAVQWSDNGTSWMLASPVAGASWPGSAASVDVVWGRVVAGATLASAAEFDGDLQDGTGRVWSGLAGSYDARQKGLARNFTTQAQAITSARISPGAGEWTFEMRIKLTPTTGSYAWVLTQDAITTPGTRGFQFIYGKEEKSFLFSPNPGVVDACTGPLTDPVADAGRYLFVVCQRKGDRISIAVDGAVNHTNLPAGYVVPDVPAVANTPLTIGPASANASIVLPFSLDALRITLGAALYDTDFATPAIGFSGAANGLNAVNGRAAPLAGLTLGAGPAMTYGIPLLSAPERLGVESGAIKDLTSGVLGQGIGRVRGTVKEKGTPNAPLKRRVRLVRERDGLCMREAWSDPLTGEYDFKYVDELQTWGVVGHDHLHNYRAVIADNLTLANGGVELMP